MSKPEEKVSDTLRSDSMIICKVCDEENSDSDSYCSGCGVKLKTNVGGKGNTNTYSSKPGKIKRKVVNAQTHITGNKVLDRKKTLLILTVVIISFIVLLVLTGKFDSGISSSTPLVNRTSSESGIDLSNLNEINELEKQVESNPEEKASVIKLANLLQDSGIFDRAVIYYKKYLGIEPSDVNARVDLGICYYNLNDYQSAITQMEEALKFQPNHQLAHLNLGIVNLSAGNLQKSRECFNKAVEINPDSDAGKRAKELLQSH